MKSLTYINAQSHDIIFNQFPIAKSETGRSLQDSFDYQNNLPSPYEDCGTLGDIAWDGCMSLIRLHWRLKGLVGKFDKDARASVIALMNEMMLEFYIGKKVVEEMYTTAFVVNWKLERGGNDVSFEFELKISWTFEGVCDRLFRLLNTTVINTRLDFVAVVFKGKGREQDFIKRLKENSRSRIFDGLIAIDHVTCQEKDDLSIPCNEIYPYGEGENLDDEKYTEVCQSLSQAPSMMPTGPGGAPTPTANNPSMMNPDDPTITRVVERFVTMNVYGMRTGESAEDTPPYYGFDKAWERETNEFVCESYRENTTIWNLECETELIGVADSNTLLNRRYLSGGETSNTLEEIKSGGSRSLQFAPVLSTDPNNGPTTLSNNEWDPTKCENGWYFDINHPLYGTWTRRCYCGEDDRIYKNKDYDSKYNPSRGTALILIYKQLFKFSTQPNIRVKADDIATTPFICYRDRERYANILKSQVSQSIVSISALDLLIVGKDYSYNVDNLVVAYKISGSELRGINENRRLQRGPQLFGNEKEYIAKRAFEAAMDKRIKSFWTLERRWVAIFDFEVSTSVIRDVYQRFRFDEEDTSTEYRYVQYQVNFRFRSFYGDDFLTPLRVVSEPMDATNAYDGPRKFLEALITNRNLEPGDELFFFGKLKKWRKSEFFEDGRTEKGDSVGMYVFIFLGILFGCFIVCEFRRWMKIDDVRLDEDSLGELQLHQSSFVDLIDSDSQASDTSEMLQIRNSIEEENKRENRRASVRTSVYGLASGTPMPQSAVGFLLDPHYEQGNSVTSAQPRNSVIAAQPRGSVVFEVTGTTEKQFTRFSLID